MASTISDKRDIKPDVPVKMKPSCVHIQDILLLKIFKDQ